MSEYTITIESFCSKHILSVDNLEDLEDVYSLLDIVKSKLSAKHLDEKNGK